MLEQYYLTNQMVDDLNDDGFTERYYSMINYNQISPNKWDIIYQHDDTAPIYWFIKCQQYLSDALRGLDPQMRCKYISISFRIILEYKFIFNYQKMAARYKPAAILKARELREDPLCTDECKATLSLFLNVVNPIN